LLEGGKELIDLVLGALDGTSKEQDNLDDFLVLSDPVVEGLTLIFGLVLLIPVLDFLSRLQHVGGSSVNGRLHFLQ
jgi:hypothetical protein